jgi:ribosome-associated translation inhibitor RaiA
MESLAIQTATGALATSNDMADVERAINDQADRIRTQARSILRRRSRNHTP